MKTDPTADQIMAMDERELQRAVAERLGWSYLKFQPAIQWYEGRAPSEQWDVVPTWPWSIEAAWELEEGLKGDQRFHYGRHLRNILMERVGTAHTSMLRLFEIAHASPADRCRAWLLTMRETDDELPPGA